jgi:hypothetical protein
LANRADPAEHKQLGDRINVMSIDKLDGKIGGDFYDRVAGEWREMRSGYLQSSNRTKNGGR